jgi:mono/diheme cytochrome c family protein
MRFFLALIIFTCISVQARAEDAASRGRYLAILGDCAGCHTFPHGQSYAGGLSFNTPFGTIYSTNITSDHETGIGDWSADDFYRALHKGIAPGGKHLYPALPYVYFTRLTRRDTDDLFAYLKTLPPVNRPPTSNRLTFPFNLRFGLMFWSALYLEETSPQAPAQASAEWKRGEYLVNGLGHCAACHTPKDMLFGDVKSRALTGGMVDNWFANDLTNNQPGGLGQWTKADVEKFLASGINSHATAAGSMAEKVSSSTSRMMDADRAAIATFLKSLPPRVSLTYEKMRPEQMARGRAVFAAHCESCHAVPGAKQHADQGSLAGYPGLAGDTLVMGRDPTTVLRIILQGGSAPSSQHLHPKPMPGFAKLDDGQIADVASYVRNDWGNSAPAVSATAVHVLRRALAKP